MNMLKGALLSLSLSIATTVWATAQIPDEVEVDGKKELLTTEALQSLIKMPGMRAKFEKHIPSETCSASWRGYQAQWVVADGTLSLKSIILDPCDALTSRHNGGAIRYLPLSELFPGTTGLVPATWFSGVLRIPQGKMVEYIHMGYASRYERTLLITVEKGRVIKREIQPGAKPAE